MRIRSAVVIVEEQRLALIRREWAGAVYYLFPGGGVEPGETEEEAAAREAQEELGLEVDVVRCIAEGTFAGNRQVFFSARRTGGRFGKGLGPEMLGRSDTGTHTAVWLEIAALAEHDVRPRSLAIALAHIGSDGAGVALRLPDE